VSSWTDASALPYIVVCISIRFNYDAGCFDSSPNLVKTISMSSKDNLSSGWSKRMAALKLSRAAMYVPGSNWIWGFLGAFCGCDSQIWIFWFLLKAEARFHSRYGKFPEPLWHTQVLLSFLHAAPCSLHLAVGSAWTVMPLSAGLLMIAPCTVRLNDLLFLTAQHPLGLLALPAPWNIGQTGWPSIECI